MPVPEYDCERDGETEAKAEAEGSADPGDGEVLEEDLNGKVHVGSWA